MATSQEKLASISSLIIQGGTLALQLFLELEPLLNLGPDEKANIANAIAAANSADADTINSVKTWMQANGFAVKVSFVRTGTVK